MKTLHLRIVTAILLSFFVTSPLVHADFFESSVLGTGVEDVHIDSINLTYYTFRNAIENTRYANMSKFITNVREEAKRRYENGSISMYRQSDIINDLGTLVHTMNQHFAFYKRFEQTRSILYRDTALDYLDNARADYERLRGTLRRSGD